MVNSAFSQEKAFNESDYKLFENRIEDTSISLEKAKDLLDRGIISNKEYKQLKQKYTKLKSAYDVLKGKNIGGSYNYLIANPPAEKLDILKDNYENYLRLYEEGIVSRKELDDVKISYTISSIIKNKRSFNDYNEFSLERLVNPLGIVVKTSLYFISSRYGNRIHPLSGLYTMHTGVDIAICKGTPVYAYDNGLVLRAGTGDKAGNFAEITHGNGYSSLYLHLDKLALKTNQLVNRGDLVGYAGSTGSSTGSHLHFEIRKNNKSLNINKLFDIKPEKITNK